MKRHWIGLLFGGCLLSLASGCGLFTSEPPAAIQEKAKQAIPKAAYTVSTGETGKRIDPVRQPIFATSPQLTRRQDRPLPEVASEALSRIGAPAVPEVVALLGDRDPAVRLRGAHILAKIGPPAEPAVPALVNGLNDVDPQVRQASAHALGQIGPAAAAAVPALLRATEGMNNNVTPPDMN